jgi:2,3-dihydroxyphenylpropionate 1,2-dioxygenase
MLMDEELAGPEICTAVAASFSTMADFVTGFDPDVIVQFSPDHFHGFHYDMMPSFCIGTAATSYGDYATNTGELVCDEAYALSLLDAVRGAEVDAAVSFDMMVDHGFVQLWEALWGDFTRYPIVPIFVNSIARPIPTYRRAIKLGRAIGNFAAAGNRKVLFAASGGLSHDPIVPQIEDADKKLRDRLTGKVKLTQQMQAEREAMVKNAGFEFKSGRSPAAPLNPEWDRAILAMLAQGDWDGLERLDTDEVIRIAGSAANETLCWVAAAAAMDASGGYKVVQNDYLEIPGWIAGFGHFAGSRADCCP